MNSKVLQVLEYTKIIERLADKATSAPGRELCLHLLPQTDLDDISRHRQRPRMLFPALSKKAVSLLATTNLSAQHLRPWKSVHPLLPENC